MYASFVGECAETGDVIVERDVDFNGAGDKIFDDLVEISMGQIAGRSTRGAFADLELREVIFASHICTHIRISLDFTCRWTYNLCRQPTCERRICKSLLV